MGIRHEQPDFLERLYFDTSRRLGSCGSKLGLAYRVTGSLNVEIAWLCDLAVSQFGMDGNDRLDEQSAVPDGFWTVPEWK